MPRSLIDIMYIAVIVTLLTFYAARYLRVKEPEAGMILKFVKKGRYDKAYETAAAKMKAVNGTDFTYHQKELFYIRFRKVIQYLEKKAARESSPEIYAALGWAHMMAQNYEKALIYLREAEKALCSDHRVNLNIAHAMKAMNWHRKALTYYRKALVLKPDDIETLLGKAEMSLILEMYKSARESYERILRISGENAEAMYGLAVCLYRMEEYSSSAEHFRKIERKGYKEADASYYIGKIAYMNGDFDTAMKYLEKATSLNYYSAEAYYTKALIHAFKKDRNAAIQNLENAVKIDDSFKEAARDERIFGDYWLFSEFRALFE